MKGFESSEPFPCKFLLEMHLVDMYAKCGYIGVAKIAFDKLLVWEIVSWTTLIWGLAEHGDGEEALRCFEKMQGDGVTLHGQTFVCILKMFSWHWWRQSHWITSHFNEISAERKKEKLYFLSKEARMTYKRKWEIACYIILLTLQSKN
jgi:pentatricopeptide repeat protein